MIQGVTRYWPFGLDQHDVEEDTNLIFVCRDILNKPLVCQLDPDVLNRLPLINVSNDAMAFYHLGISDESKGWLGEYFMYYYNPEVKILCCYRDALKTSKLSSDEIEKKVNEILSLKIFKPPNLNTYSMHHYRMSRDLEKMDNNPDQLPGFGLTLYKHQLLNIKWMMGIESEEASEANTLYNTVHISRDPGPNPNFETNKWYNTRIGILADASGMGKAVSVLGLIKSSVTPSEAIFNKRKLKLGNDYDKYFHSGTTLVITNSNEKYYKWFRDAHKCFSSDFGTAKSVISFIYEDGHPISNTRLVIANDKEIVMMGNYFRFQVKGIYFSRIIYDTLSTININEFRAEKRIIGDIIWGLSERFGFDFKESVSLIMPYRENIFFLREYLSKFVRYNPDDSIEKLIKYSHISKRVEIRIDGKWSWNLPICRFNVEGARATLPETYTDILNDLSGHLTCKVCLIVISDHNYGLLKCKHVFCINCVNEYIIQNIKLCPICRVEFEYGWHIDRSSDFGIDANSFSLKDCTIFNYIVKTLELKPQSIFLIVDEHRDSMKRLLKNRSISYMDINMFNGSYFCDDNCCDGPKVFLYYPRSGKNTYFWPKLTHVLCSKKENVNVCHDDEDNWLAKRACNLKNLSQIEVVNFFFNRDG